MTFGSELSHFSNESLSAVVLDRDGIIRAVDFKDIALNFQPGRRTENLVGMPFMCLHDLDDSAKLAISDGVGQVCQGVSDRFCYRFELNAREAYELVADHNPPNSDNVVVTYAKIDPAAERQETASSGVTAPGIHEALFEHLPISILFQDKQGMVQLANPACEKMLGLSQDELKLVTPDQMPWKLYDSEFKLLEVDGFPWMVCLKAGKPQNNFIIGYETKTRGLTWIKANSDLVIDSKSGEYCGVLTSFSDITEERETQFELQSQTERTQIAVENADMGVWDWIPEGNHMIWDKKMFQLYGYPDDGLVSPQEVWSRAIHREDVQKVKSEIFSLINDNSQKNVNFRTVWPDGTTHYLSARARVIKDNAGKVVRVIGVTHDVTNDVMAERKLWDLAYTDNLTGAYSRAGLNFRLSRTIARCLQSDSKFCVLMMGLIRFKEINENYGLASGDKILTEVSRRAKEMLKDNDTVARVGGDEFTLVLECVEATDKIADFIRGFREKVLNPVLLSDGLSVNLDAAIGVSVFPDDGYDTSSLQTNASLAMHNDRTRESPSYMQYSKAMSDEVSRKFNLKYQLYSAVKSQEFQLYYQPIIDLHDNKVIGCEALIRWKDNAGQFVSPMEFIPVVEESGLIYELGKWINLTAVKQWKMWQHLVPELKYISVNVSPRQLENVNFIDDLVAMVNAHGINPENLQLEITEGTFLQDSLHSDSTLRKLACYGFRLAIDDFGTGYSSLAYLKRFNVDVIKIDRSFIKDIETDESDRNIVSAILAMNKKLGFKTLVEGIETDKQNEIVHELGCDSAQGYLYGRPTFADEFAEVYIQNTSRH